MLSQLRLRFQKENYCTVLNVNLSKFIKITYLFSKLAKLIATLQMIGYALLRTVLLAELV